MNELENQLAELVRKGIEVAESTGNFVIDQAPQLLQEFYRWHIISNAMGMTGVLIIIMIICFINDLFDLVKLIVAPKIYLIEYFIK